MKKNILIGASGSISILNLPFWIQQLHKAIDCNIKVILTQNARSFIKEELLEVLIQDHIYTGMFTTIEFSAPHSSLSKWADLLIVLPATANIIGKSANGIADDLLSSTILTMNKQVIFVPSMNDEMWNSKVVQRNKNILIEDGRIIVEPEYTLNYQVSTSKEVYGPSINMTNVIINVLRSLKNA